MRIAFTHNLQTSSSEEEAEFDTPETVEAISEALRSLGHEVEPIDVSGPISILIARLEAYRPDLVFNTAEGRRGRFREAFYPAVFDQLGMPYTASDAYACLLTLDKQLTKSVLAEHGVPAPRGVLAMSAGRDVVGSMRYPMILKPNFEGSSKGIDQSSIVETPEALEAKLESLLSRYPDGVLVEEFITGKDVVVPFLELASPDTKGVLPAVEYVFGEAAVAGRKYQIYEYDLKQTLSDHVDVRVPAELSPDVAEKIEQVSQTVFSKLNIRDLGRIDYRVNESGEVYFIEINALPSLEPGAGIYSSAALRGLTTMESVLDCVIRSAVSRWNIAPSTGRRKSPPKRVGLIYNLKRQAQKMGGADDDEAEYDSPKTISSIRQAIESFGHEVVELEATPELATLLPTTGIDVAFNIAEGLRGRNRESQVPALLELLDIEYTGSDPAALSLTLDKALAKRIVGQAGVATPKFFLMRTGKEKVPADLRYPVIVKPVAEGSSKGVQGTSVATDEEALRRLGQELSERYAQPCLVEEFLPGREFTIGLLGNGRRLKVLPPMEIVFSDPNVEHPVYTFDLKLDVGEALRYEAPAKVDPALGRKLADVARRSFNALGCRDVARIDVRLDSKGQPNFIECNPLPGLTPGWSDLCQIADAAGIEYRSLVGEILAPALRRARVAAKHKPSQVKAGEK